MAAIHQDTSDDREVVREKLEEVFGVRCLYFKQSLTSNVIYAYILEHLTLMLSRSLNLLQW